MKTRSNYRYLLLKKKTFPDTKTFLREEFEINHWIHNLRNSTIVRRMVPFTCDIYNGVLGRVTSKVRKKGKEMNKIKTLKSIKLNKSMIGHKLGEFTLNRNFLKHTIKKKKK